VEVRGKVAYQGAPVQRGLITFRPANGAKGPAAGAAIVDGKFLIPADKGPVAGRHEVQVKVVNVESASTKSGEPVLLKRDPGQLKTFTQQVEIAKGINEFDFSFPNAESTIGKNAPP
jgi:hypothetical protein